MERRKAITTAAAASLTLLAGAAGITLSSGIVGGTTNDGIGDLTPVGVTSNPPVTVHVDEPTTTTFPVAPTVQATDRSPVTTSSASNASISGAHGDDEEEGEDDFDGAEGESSEDEDHHEREDHYEGADDDD